ncbi:hypothetical protein NDU88_007119 [Pleurodeles waltl]|uniref:Uncharacterized protein n=1 Tax=Pleurodeles waltl TaxID=8319 RepID=A0AAV7U0C1_PLEWA|nr:hypothetical protein NDU88_007119 [Pleurodeles waltl]
MHGGSTKERTAREGSVLPSTAAKLKDLVSGDTFECKDVLELDYDVESEVWVEVASKRQQDHDFSAVVVLRTVVAAVGSDVWDLFFLIWGGNFGSTIGVGIEQDTSDWEVALEVQ